jgi:hypothetical protein
MPHDGLNLKDNPELVINLMEEKELRSEYFQEFIQSYNSIMALATIGNSS